MRCLLDTHTFLWFLQDAPELPSAVADRIEADSAENHVSAATVWEMAIKISLGKLSIWYSLDRDLPEILSEGGFEFVPLRFTHLGRVAQLPLHHRDPFDRVLVAQAQTEGFTVLSRNRVFDAYGVSRVWA